MLSKSFTFVLVLGALGLATAAVSKANNPYAGLEQRTIKALSEDDTVSLIGFGTFSRRSRAERKGKNPQTGAELIIPASNTAAFKPGKGLKEKVQ